MPNHITLKLWLQTNHPEVYMQWMAKAKQARAEKAKARYQLMAQALKEKQKRVVHK